MNFYFLFLESLGTPELILIAFVALMVFGPRKLPSLGRTIGKYTTEFKRASNEFRRNWESEVEAAERDEKVKDEKAANATGLDNLANTNENLAASSSAIENTIGRGSARKRQAVDETSFAALNENNSIALPEIRAINQSDVFATTESTTTQTESVAAPRKREWL